MNEDPPIEEKPEHPAMPNLLADEEAKIKARIKADEDWFKNITLEASKKAKANKLVIIVTAVIVGVVCFALGLHFGRV